MKKKGCIAAILVVVALVVGVPLAGQKVKQWLLYPYATPERVEEVFQSQIAALMDVAEKKKTPEEVALLFEDPLILGATAIHQCSDDGRNRNISFVKKRSPESTETSSGWIWFPMNPGVDRPVVNVSGGRRACYEKMYRDGPELIRGVERWVDLDALKEGSE